MSSDQIAIESLTMDLIELNNPTYIHDIYTGNNLANYIGKW